MNIITRDVVWVVRNRKKLVQNRKTLSPAGLMDTSAVIRGCREENRLESPTGDVATAERPQPGAPRNQGHGHKLQNRSASRTPQP